MNRKVSMTDIARQLNVSQATVSYVLNGREGGIVSERTRQRVLETARQMGYRRNRAAQALAGQRSYLIELCVNGFYPAFYGRVLDAFENQLAPTPYQLHIVNPDFTSEEAWTDGGGGWPVDGLIIADAYFPGAALRSLLQSGVPVVSTGIYADTTTDHVRIDLSPALLEAMRHLVARGNRVACMSMWPTHPDGNPDPRYRSYRQVMQEANLPEELIVAPGINSVPLREAVRQTVRDYLTQNGCPDGIFCFNDERAIASLTALRDLNLRVPQDVLLIGCDGIEETAYHHPAISTILYPYDEAARLSWEFLSRRMEQPDLPLQSATLTAPLVLRESSARES